MAEGTALKGVANLSALGSAGLLCLAALLGVLSLALPWWSGTSKVGSLVDQATVQSTITLWAFQNSVGQPAKDSSGGTTLQTVEMDMTWDQMCKNQAQTAEGEPPHCAKVRAIRAFAILTPIFALTAASMVMLARSVSPLLLLLGALLEILTGVFAVLGVILGVFTDTSGLTGSGFVCLIIAVFLSFTSLSVTFYAASVAMPVESAASDLRESRTLRAQAHRRKEADLEAQLSARNPQFAARQSGQLVVPESPDGGGDEDGAGKKRTKPPVMLKRILFWSQEHDQGSDEIPTEMLELAFREIDEDGSGSIELEELVECLCLCGLNASVEATGNILKEIDKNASNNIDIHEFVAFFRHVEELERFSARTQQRAQFAQVLCNFCFIAHIIIVSALLMRLINMKEADDPDNYLIFKNLLYAFSIVLAILLVSVICIPAAKLTLGSNFNAWQRAYQAEVEKRMRMGRGHLAAAPEGGQNASTGNLRQAAWNAGGTVTTGLTQQTVNAAMFGASYRVKNQNAFAQSAIPDIYQASLQGVTVQQSAVSPLRRPAVGAGAGNANWQANQPQAQPGIILAKDGSIERYDPNAYRHAALRSMEARVPASFSPMQVRDLNMPHDEPAMPGTLALQDSVGGGLTGTGYYHREL